MPTPEPGSGQEVLGAEELMGDSQGHDPRISAAHVLALPAARGCAHFGEPVTSRPAPGDVSKTPWLQQATAQGLPLPGGVLLFVTPWGFCIYKLALFFFCKHTASGSLLSRANPAPCSRERCLLTALLLLPFHSPSPVTSGDREQCLPLLPLHPTRTSRISASLSSPLLL